LDGWVNGADSATTNFYRNNPSRINNSLAPACMQAKWIFKTGSNMPSTINVQGQVQASIPHVPWLDDPNAAAFMIQSAFYDPSDARSSGHIVDGIDARMEDMFNELYGVLRNLNNHIFRSLQSAVMHVRAVVDAGESVRHFELEPHENGNYIYSTF
jgi:hypothetical protein